VKIGYAARTTKIQTGGTGLKTLADIGVYRMAGALAAGLMLALAAGCGASDEPEADGSPASQEATAREVTAAIQENVSAVNTLDPKRYCASVSEAAQAEDAMIRTKGLPCEEVYKTAFDYARKRNDAQPRLSAKVAEIMVKGDTATATIAPNGPQGRATDRYLVKEGGDWKMSTAREVYGRLHN
jgi:hypothetical protein